MTWVFVAFASFIDSAISFIINRHPSIRSLGDLTRFIMAEAIVVIGMTIVLPIFLMTLLLQSVSYKAAGLDVDACCCAIMLVLKPTLD